MGKKKNKKKKNLEDTIRVDIGLKEDEILNSYKEFKPEIIETHEIDEEEFNKRTRNYEKKNEDKEEIVIVEEYDDDTTSYDTNNEEVEEVIEEDIELEEEKPIKKKKNKARKIINIIFVLIMLALVMITVDVIAVAKYNKGPFFAVPLTIYNDGGTKEYYGLGYKVFKYNQLQGRRDMEIGSWALKYNTDIITTDTIDMAIEFSGNESEAYKKYYKKFVRINSILQKIDKKNNKIKVGYTDEDGKYSLDISCKMATDKDALSKLEINKEITIIGTVYKFDYKTDKTPSKLYISGCFAEQ